MTTFKTLISVAVAAGIASISLSGCNTMEGMGKDIKKAGEKVESVAKPDAKKDEKKK